MNESDRLEEIFSQATQIADLEERDRYVQQACRGDAELAQQIFSLLTAAPAAAGFLESPVWHWKKSAGTSPPMDYGGVSAKPSEFPFLGPPIVPDDLGSLGHYRVLNWVGRGGMGIVFRGLDPQLKRVVAIKVLAPEAAVNPLFRKRFEREAYSAAAVSDPHVVVIHAVNNTHHPPFIVMEFIQGKTLAEKIASQGPLSVPEILRIGSQIANGLAAAHKQGVVHRDMKPANVLLENGVERAKVADFGLAKAVDDVTLSRTGDITGTPEFMSPEQASGGKVDHRTDLYSLGAILYAMCTGKPPFRAENLLAMLRQIREDTPRPIQRVNPEIPRWLCAIVDRLLQKVPTNRFETAAEVADLLQKHLVKLQEGRNFDLTALETKVLYALNLLRRGAWPILAFSLLAGIALIVRFALSRMPENSSSHAETTNSFSQAPSGNSPPENGAQRTDASSAERTTKTEPAEIASAKGSKLPDPFDGTNAGDRRSLTRLQIEFRWCPPGHFTVARPKLEAGGDKQVEVTLTRGFWMQETEVTQSEWLKVMGSMPDHQMNKGKGDRHPIYYVSHDEAMKFCKQLTDQEWSAARLPSGWEYRLPTELQWEYACRAGTESDTAFGDELSSKQANFNGDWPHNGAPKGPNLQMAVAVGSYPSNKWGLRDMHGNVKEFISTPGRVRGGSWFDSGRNCCSGIFIPDAPYASESVGFRLALVSVFSGE